MKYLIGQKSCENSKLVVRYDEHDNWYLKVLKLVKATYVDT
jgi:hypothetical protein